MIAEHGYEGAAGSDQDSRSQAVSRFLSDCRSGSAIPSELNPSTSRRGLPLGQTATLCAGTDAGEAASGDECT